DFYAPLLTVGSCTPLLKGQFLSYIGTTTVYKCTSQRHSKLFLSLAFIAVLHTLICLVVHVHDIQYYNMFIFHFSFLRYF
ncbi:hypothetical protein D917_05976, partial [Trichinella nativa]